MGVVLRGGSQGSHAHIRLEFHRHRRFAAQVKEVRLSYGSDGRLSKNARREAAREKAKTLRDEQKKKDRRTKLYLQGGIILGVLAFIAIVALVIVNAATPPGPGPLNMRSDGIQLSQGAVALETPALASGQKPVANKVDKTPGSINMQLYVDYLCPFCGQFEKTDGDYISSILENGAATVEIHPMSILDRASQGTKYSTRSANAAACVANYSPNQFYAFHRLLFANQPAEQTSGLTDDQLIALTVKAKVKSSGKIATCIRDQQFKAWVKEASDRVNNDGVPNSDQKDFTGTPTVVVNGLKYTGPLDDLSAFQAFVVHAAGQTFNESSTSTPTPSATP
jgi:protein-disulfide isomerase